MSESASIVRAAAVSPSATGSAAREANREDSNSRVRGFVGREPPELELEEGDGAAIGLLLAGIEASPAMEMALDDDKGQR